MKKYALIITLLLSIGLFSCSNEKQDVPEQTQNNQEQTEQTTSKTQLAILKTVNPVTIPNKVADFSFELKGETIKFSEFAKDKKVILNFWGTWCPPCRAELPALVEISNDNLDKDWLVLGISLERAVFEEQKKIVATFIKNNRIHYIDVIGEQELIGQLINNFGGIQGVPSTFFIGTDLMIQETHVGGMNKAGFEELMNKVK